MQWKANMSIEAIRQFQAASGAIELKGQARSDLFDVVEQYAARYLDSIATAPAYGTPAEPGMFSQLAAVGNEGEDIEQVLDLLAEHVDSVGINPTSGRFLGFIPGGALVYSALGDLLAAVANRY